MFIRRTTIKSRAQGEPYVTHRLVESIRTEQGVRQRTLLNLGRYFDLPKEQWPALVIRLEQLLEGQGDLLGSGLDPMWEPLAEQIVAKLLHARSRSEEDTQEPADFQSVDLHRLDVLRPRSVGVEHVSLEVLRQLGLDDKLEALGFNRPQRAAAIGTLIARMAAPASELATHAWLGERSGLGELIDFDFTKLSLTALYRIGDQLYRHQAALEEFLSQRERSLFDLDEVITLYDLTNTYFEGEAKANSKAVRGNSKEKRSDCPLVTLALVLNGSGFPKRSAVLPGNVSEPKTLATMLEQLVDPKETRRPTVVLDAGLATEDNVAWLCEQGYAYVVVSRKRHREFDPEQAVVVKEREALKVAVQRKVNEDSGEVELYCHSSKREAKERGIDQHFAKNYEAALRSLAEGLHKKRTVKRYPKVLERLGRLKQTYARVARYYQVEVQEDPDTGLASTITWQRKTETDDTFPGVYCLRTNQADWDEARLWRTYTMLTDLEAVFRSLKSELGLRPVFHHKPQRVSAHLFISVLAYHLVHSIRFQLKADDIDQSWNGLRRALSGQERVTIELKRKDGATVHVRRSSRPEPRQQRIYDALGIATRPGRTETTVTNIPPSATM